MPAIGHWKKLKWGLNKRCKECASVFHPESGSDRFPYGPFRGTIRSRKRSGDHGRRNGGQEDGTIRRCVSITSGYYESELASRKNSFIERMQYPVFLSGEGKATTVRYASTTGSQRIRSGHPSDWVPGFFRSIACLVHFPGMDGASSRSLSCAGSFAQALKGKQDPRRVGTGLDRTVYGLSPRRTCPHPLSFPYTCGETSEIN